MGLKPSGSFEAWSARVRSALVWLGEDDPCGTVERFHQAEPEGGALGEGGERYYNYVRAVRTVQ